MEFGTLAEQLDETHYDNRVDADDDLEKGRIKFPSHKLYGRDEPLKQLHSIFQQRILSSSTSKNKQLQDATAPSANHHHEKEEEEKQETVNDLTHNHYNDSSSATTTAFDNSYNPVVFLAGYSGTGKSSLVDCFVQQIRSMKQGSKENHSSSLAPCWYLTGKFTSPLQASNIPFSALARALNTFVLQLVSLRNSQGHDDYKAWIDSFCHGLRKLDIYRGSDHAAVLEATLIPALSRLWQPPSSATGTAAATSSPSTTPRSTTVNLSLVQFTARNFLRALTSTTSKMCSASTVRRPPVILFLDDVQWADAASLQLLSALLVDVSLHNILFVLAYRPNEVDDKHDFCTIVQNKVWEARGLAPGKDKDKDEPTTNTTATLSDLSTSKNIHSMEIFNLSPDSIAEFIADSIEKTPEDVALVADAIYQKTLGNIFFVKQAMEELVRKNALYYDMVMFEWQFGNVSRVELEQFLSEDVLEMVQSKIQTMPQTLQKAMVLAAYTSQSTIDISLLHALLQTDPSMDPQDVTLDALHEVLDRAFVEGLMLRVGNQHLSSQTTKFPSSANGRNGKACHPTSCPRYQFAHDRIREAAGALVPPGPERDQLLLRISKVLLKQSATSLPPSELTNRTARVEEGPIFEDSQNEQDEEDSDWMLFTAARHLNSLPVELTRDMELADLNLKVGKIAVQRRLYRSCHLFATRCGLS